VWSASFSMPRHVATATGTHVTIYQAKAQNSAETSELRRPLAAQQGWRVTPPDNRIPAHICATDVGVTHRLVSKACILVEVLSRTRTFSYAVHCNHMGLSRGQSTLAGQQPK